MRDIDYGILARRVTHYEQTLGLKQVNTQAVYSFKFGGVDDLRKLIRSKTKLYEALDYNLTLLRDRLYSNTNPLSYADGVILQSMIIETKRAAELVDDHIINADRILTMYTTLDQKTINDRYRPIDDEYEIPF